MNPQQVLGVALGLDPVTIAALETAGVRRWDAITLVRRLTLDGSLVEGRWQPEAAERLRTGLAPSGPTAIERLADADRPREKARAGGVDSLDDAELLALVLRTGIEDEGVIEVAQRLLNQHGGVVGLARLTIDQLVDNDGIGPAKATELAAAFALGRRLATSSARKRPSAASPEAAAALVAPLLAGLAHEELWVLCLDPRNQLIGEPRLVTRGDVDGTDAGPRAVLRLALLAGATGCIVVHNHPSGDPAPSSADIASTRRLAQAARQVDLPLLDHLVIGSGGSFVSIRRAHPEAFA